MDERLREHVFSRAQGCCEYCHFPEKHAYNPFHVDHIIARQHGGATELDNLAAACFYCNTFKGPNIAGWIAESGSIVRLFHPRTDQWIEHFEWRGPLLMSTTDIGLATV